MNRLKAISLHLTALSDNTDSTLLALELAVVATRNVLTDQAGIPLVPGVDTLARLTAISASLEKLTDSIKSETRDAMKARGVTHMEGANFACDLRETVRATIDVQRLRADLPDVAQAYENRIPQTSLHFKTRGA